MSREFINEDMLAAGESVLQQSINVSDLRDIAAKVFQAMSEARDAWRERKDREIPLPDNRWLAP